MFAKPIIKQISWETYISGLCYQPTWRRPSIEYYFINTSTLCV